MINGLFEIHITVDHTDKNGGNGFYNLYNYVSKNNGMKLILAVAKNGDYPNQNTGSLTQYMISKFKNGTEQEVIERALEIAREMKQENIEVLRVKVESMAFNDGVPVTMEDYKKYILLPKTGKPYFEFHAKIKPFNNELESLVEFWNKNTILKPHVFVALSINLLSRSENKNPLLTIRVYDGGRIDAIDLKNAIFDDLKNKNYHIIDAIQQEFSVYDTNENLDKGWLI